MAESAKTYIYTSSIRRSFSTGSNKDNTGITSKELTDDLIDDIPIGSFTDGDITGNLVISSMTVSINTGNNWQGYHRARFRLDIKEEGSSTITSYYSSWKTGLYTNGSYQRVILTIDFPEDYKVRNFNEDTIKLYLETKWEKGSGTLWYYGNIGDNSYIQYNFSGSSMIFLEPANDSNYNQYTDSLNIIIPNQYFKDEEKPYTIFLRKNENIIKSESWNEKSTSDNTIFDFGELTEIGEIYVGCKNNSSELKNEIKINVIKNNILSVVPEITRYRTIDGSETDFLGQYVGIKLTISTLISSFLNKDIKIKINNNMETIIIGEETKEVTHELSSQFIVNYQQRQTCDPSVLTTIPIVIYLIENNSNTSIFNSNINVPAAIPIFNIEENGVGIGQFTTGTSNLQKFECAWPAYFENGIYLKSGNNWLPINIDPNDGHLYIQINNNPTP